MVQLVEAIAKSLVDDPASVVVTSEENKQGITISLRVAPDDMGKVIGKQGKIAGLSEPWFVLRRQRKRKRLRWKSYSRKTNEGIASAMPFCTS